MSEATCAMCGNEITQDFADAYQAVGSRLYFCDPACGDAFEAMPGMKAITLQFPHAPWVFAPKLHGGGKDIENRDYVIRCVSIGEAFAIHQGLKDDPMLRFWIAGEHIRKTMEPYSHPGCILGVVTLSAISKPSTHSTRWGDPYRVWWHLSNPIKLPSPIKCTGRQGPWTVPPDIEALIRRQLRGERGKA